jgi:sugar/nucleoside kinase (ribokinase family)
MAVWGTDAETALAGAVLTEKGGLERPCGGPDACELGSGQLGSGQCPGPLPRRRVHVFGTVFFDLVYSGLPVPPSPGTEVRAAHLGISPGGVANVAVALARLGLDVGLSAVFAEDAFGQYLWSALVYEGIDLSLSVQSADWTTPVTTSFALGRERSLVTYEASPPVDVATLLPDGYRADAFVISMANAGAHWLRGLHRFTPLVFADVGWDVEQLGSSALADRLAAVDVFMPNAAEARACTGTDDAEQAAAALATSGRLVVVKDSSSGSFAIDPSTRSGLRVPGLKVEARDTTGAGDVFDAGFIYASLAGWPLEQAMRFANLCAAESVKHEGGSLAAPCWRDLAAFWDKLEDDEVRRAYGFLPPLLTKCPARQACTRACPTMSPPPLASAPAGAA